MNVERIILAEPRGFCAGVEMAIKALTWMVNLFPGPVYCYHEIVHNQRVVDMFRSQGVIFVDDINEVPAGAPVMLSAHGSAPEVVQRAHQLTGVVVDAVCPLVTKVHHELKVRAEKGYAVIYIGHEGHDEAVGTMAVAPEAVHLVETIADVDALEIDNQPVALLAQTTLAHNEWKAISDQARTRFPEMWTPSKSDLCFATTNRQAAVKQLAPLVDSLIVIGSENSSNTMALAKMAKIDGAKRVLRVNSASELPDDLRGTVGLTAGASAPEELVDEIIESIGANAKIELLRVTEEAEYFPIPRELRELTQGIHAFVSAAFGAPPLETSDREIAASSVLMNNTYA